MRLPRTDLRRTASGFTLLELLVVLGLVAVLFGIGAGMFKKMGMGKTVALAQVKDAVRAARTFAIEQSATATVEFDAVNGRILASGFVTVGNWHFEDDISTGWPSDADLGPNTEIIDDGAIGRAVRLTDEHRGAITLGRAPAFDPDQGLLIDLFVRAGADVDAPLVSKGRGYALHLSADGGLTFTVRARERGAAGKGEGELRSLALSGCLVLGRYERIQAAYDGRRIRIVVDGRERGRREFDTALALWPDPDAPLQIGSLENRLAADVDELRISSSVVNDAPPLPDGVVFDKPDPIFFGPDGRLDPLRHATPARVTLVFDEGARRRDVVVSMFGEIQ
jgi:prepilin-type N-terminal cleavage/methylation domain-containing protein